MVSFFPNFFILLRAVAGSIARRVLLVKSSRSLCTVRRLFSRPGGTLPASPPLGSKITPITFRRRINSYIVGINEASLLRHEITPILVVSFHLPQRRCIFVSYYPFRGLSCCPYSTKLLPWPLVGSASVSPPERCIRTCKRFGQRQGVRLDERRFMRTLHT